jgi:methanogenic corrinoid protein MtbC1
MLLNKGYKISKLSQMCRESLKQAVSDQFVDARNDKDYYAAQINNLVVAMLELDEPLFEKTFANCVLRYGLENTFVKVIYPFLSRVGFLWCTNDTMPAQEHFCSNLIRQKVYAAIDGLNHFDVSGKQDVFLLYLPGNEYHDIGLLIANFYIRKHGFKVVNLGPSVPFDDLGKICDMVQPNHILTFFITPRPIKEVNDYLEKLSANIPIASIWVSGNGKLLEKAFLPENVQYLQAIPDLLRVLESNRSIVNAS